jgi:hypothetical protein
MKHQVEPKGFLQEGKETKEVRIKSIVLSGFF